MAFLPFDMFTALLITAKWLFLFFFARWRCLPRPGNEDDKFSVIKIIIKEYSNRMQKIRKKMR